jgi:hypothetical protein
MMMKSDHAAVTRLKRIVVTAAPVVDADLTDQTADSIHPVKITTPIPPKKVAAHQPGKCPTRPLDI